MRVYEEGDVVEMNGQKFLVVFVEYTGSMGKPFLKHIELKGIRDDH